MKTKSIVILVGSIVGVSFIGVIALVVGGLVMAFNSADATLSPTIDELFTAMENDAFAETYDTHTTADVKQNVTREKYADLGIRVKSRLGALKSKTMRQVHIRQNNSNTIAEFTYDAQFEKGSGTIRGKFQKEGDRWLVVALFVDSPLLQQDLLTDKCPHCNEPHSSTAKFCPNCGQSLTTETE